jgi:hypothetical protein
MRKTKEQKPTLSEYDYHLVMSGQWVSVDKAMPQIPEGRHGISVIVAEFDSIYEEINPGHGYGISKCLYAEVGPAEIKLWGYKEGDIDFLQIYSGPEGSEWGPCGDLPTHWMYMPRPPEIPEHIKKILEYEVKIDLVDNFKKELKGEINEDI